MAEGKKYNLYAKEFTKLDAIIEKAGPFWAEENILESSAFSSLNPGFTFVLGMCPLVYFDVRSKPEPHCLWGSMVLDVYSVAC